MKRKNLASQLWAENSNNLVNDIFVNYHHKGNLKLLRFYRYIDESQPLKRIIMDRLISFWIIYLLIYNSDGFWYKLANTNSFFASVTIIQQYGCNVDGFETANNRPANRTEQKKKRKRLNWFFSPNTILQVYLTSPPSLSHFIYFSSLLEVQVIQKRKKKKKKNP